jgi:hypothetical protein
MNAAEYVVPVVLRGAMFLPRQAPGRREPARVTPGAFRAAGLPVPGHPAQRNVCQLTRRLGLSWTPGLDGYRRIANGRPSVPPCYARLAPRWSAPDCSTCWRTPAH